MCCLFGMLDYKHNLTPKQQSKIISVLSVACEARGTDATGFAYNTPDRLCVYKRPLPARKMNFKLPREVTAIMGHTRMTTQGTENKNFNNHPFYGRTKDNVFALAHNGVLHNDLILRKQENIPETKIETDSYIAVQLIEKKNLLNTDSLKYMAESLEGSFTITLLDRKDNLYFVKGDNPMCIYLFEDVGIYLYASTEEILKKAIKKIPYRLGKPREIKITEGDILIINAYGERTTERFDTTKLYDFAYIPYSFWTNTRERATTKSYAKDEYIKQLKHEAECYGFSANYIDTLLADGFSTDDIEELVFGGYY